MKKDSFYRKHPYGAAISSALLCTFITVLGSALPQILVLPERWQMAVTSAFLALSALIGLIIVYQLKTSLGKCGGCRFFHHIWHPAFSQYLQWKKYSLSYPANAIRISDRYCLSRNRMHY